MNRKLPMLDYNTSFDQHQASSILHQATCFLKPGSCIPHSLSSIQYPASRIKSLLLILIFCMFGQSFSQDSLKTNDLFSVKPKYLIPESRSDIQFQSLNLNYNDLNMKNRYNYTPDHLRQSPFSVDTRSSSFYTPRLVRDELNLMMHRPRDSAFMPILGVAFIAIQMASKYLLVERELQIKTSNVLSCDTQLPILEALWEQNPQTCNQLYKQEAFNKKYTYSELEKDINLLIDQNLVKSKRMEDDSIQYFPALDRAKMQYTLKMGRKDPLLTTIQVNQIDSLIIYFGNTSPYID